MVVNVLYPELQAEVLTKIGTVCTKAKTKNVATIRVSTGHTYVIFECGSYSFDVHAFTILHPQGAKSFQKVI